MLASFSLSVTLSIPFSVSVSVVALLVMLLLFMIPLSVMMSGLLAFASTMLLFVLMLILMFFTISRSRPSRRRSRSGTVGRLCNKGAYFLLPVSDLSIGFSQVQLLHLRMERFFKDNLLRHLKEELIISLHLSYYHSGRYL